MRLINDLSQIKELQTTLTQRGQVTLPVAVQRILNVRPREKVTFQIIANEIRLTTKRFTLESAYGSISPRQKPENFDKLIRQAKEEKAKKTLST